MNKEVKQAIKNFGKQHVKTAVKQAQATAEYYTVLLREIECLEVQVLHLTRACEQADNARDLAQSRVRVLEHRERQKESI